MPYPSTHATAEWIEETPLEIGTNAGFASLPNLSNSGWTSATVIGSNSNVIGAPFAPNSTADGFNECTWASTCS